MQNAGLMELMAAVEKIKAAYMFDRMPQAVATLREMVRVAQEMERQITAR